MAADDVAGSAIDDDRHDPAESHERAGQDAEGAGVHLARIVVGRDERLVGNPLDLVGDEHFSTG